MARTAITILEHRYVVNGSLVRIPGTQNYDVINGTLIKVNLPAPYRDSQLNELLYVIIVIVFYATALMTLIITQIKRQRREGTEVDYYDEYLQRNSEVKRTCQAATTVVSKAPSNTQSQRVTAALASAAVAAASAGSIMGSHEDFDDGTVLLKNERPADCVLDMKGSTSPGASIGKMGVAGGNTGRAVLGFSVSEMEKGLGGAGTGTVTGLVLNSLSPLLGSSNNGASLSPSFGRSRLAFPRDRSPTRVLESIPDEGVEE